jgi:hypothetical protein
MAPRALITAGLVLAAGCTTSDAPDARVAPRFDAMVAVDAAEVDGEPAEEVDGSVADASVTADAALDASPGDGPLAIDAQAADAAPPDAPLPSGPAGLLINELSPAMAGGHDLVELLVTRSGTTAGIRLEKDFPRTPAVLAALPDVIVYEGQIIVVHLAPAGTTAAAETLAIDEKPTADNFATAWDFLGTAEHLPQTNFILSLRDADDEVTSAVPFFRPGLNESDDNFPRLFPSDLQTIIADGLWDETCVPSPCTYQSNLAAVTVVWLGAGSGTDPSSASGASVSRKPGGVNARRASDWQPVPTTAPYNSYGAPN